MASASWMAIKPDLPSANCMRGKLAAIGKWAVKSADFRRLPVRYSSHGALPGEQLVGRPNRWWKIPPTCRWMNSVRTFFGGKLKLARALIGMEHGSAAHR